MDKRDQKQQPDKKNLSLPLLFKARKENQNMDLRELPISTMAWIGDSVFDLYIRLNLVNLRSRSPSGNLHQEAIKLVCASAQAKGINALLPLLDEKETALVRRAKNHEPHSLPRNVDHLQYRMATALEALIGYHYLSGNYDRLAELMQIILSTED